MLLISLTDLNFLVTPLFYKIQSLISVALSSGITFLLRAVCFPSPHNADVGENRLHDYDQLKECLRVRQGGGTTVLCQFAFRFSQFYLSKTVFIYIVRSPRFIPSLCLYVQSGVLILHLRLYLKRNSSIYKNFTLANTDTFFFNRCFLLV